MATDPVASAASANPLLTTLVAAVTAAGLVDTLNSRRGLTVFAPANPAFAKIPKADLNALLGATRTTLTEVLTHHVVRGQIAPDQLGRRARDPRTATCSPSRVTGRGLTVGNEKANVLCGNIPTANATVYVIDTVLMP